MKSLKALFKMKATYIGIGAAIMFQLIFFTVWMTAYDGIDKRTDNINVGLVNEDNRGGSLIFDQLKSEIPFNIEIYKSTNEAQQKLNDNDIAMFIHIPKEFTKRITSGEKATINYWINESNATMTKTMMESTVYLINNAINKQVYENQKHEIETVIGNQLTQLHVPEQLLSQVESSVKVPFATLDSEPVESYVMKINETKQFSSNLVPLMIIISSFVGAMVMVMQHEEAVQAINTKYSKWDLFLSRQLINVSVAGLLPIMTLCLISIFNISTGISLFLVYLFQFVLYWAFLSFAQVFVLLFGNIGMVFNVLALSLQLVTSGVLVPREVLSDSYNNIASFLPASYGANGYYTIVFGGNNTNIKENLLALSIIITVSLLIAICTVAIQSKRKQTQHVSI